VPLSAMQSPVKSLLRKPSKGNSKSQNRQPGSFNELFNSGGIVVPNTGKRDFRPIPSTAAQSKRDRRYKNPLD
jgi:hypothetical protein